MATSVTSTAVLNLSSIVTTRADFFATISIFNSNKKYFSCYFFLRILAFKLMISVITFVFIHWQIWASTFTEAGSALILQLRIRQRNLQKKKEIHKKTHTHFESESTSSDNKLSKALWLAGFTTFRNKAASRRSNTSSATSIPMKVTSRAQPVLARPAERPAGTDTRRSTCHGRQLTGT